MRVDFHKLHILLFAGFLLLGGGLCVLHGERNFSEMENRVLTAFPPVSIEGIKSGDVQRDFEKAMGDQITGRDLFVKLSTGVRYAMGERSIGDVYIGADGRYLEKATEGDVSEKRIFTNVSVIENLAREHSDIKTSVFLAPTNSIVGRNFLPAGAYLYDDMKVAGYVMKAAPDAALIYEPDSFASDDYFRSDHHWTTYGAMYGTKLYLDSIGKSGYMPVESDFAYMRTPEPFFGTLYSKAPLSGFEGEYFVYPVTAVPLRVTIDRKEAAGLMSGDGDGTPGIYDLSYLDKKDKYAMYFGGNFGLITIENDEAKTRDTLLVVKDSYANSMIPYLSQVYKKIIMTDLRYYNASFSQLLDEEAPDELLFMYEMSDFCEDENFSKLLR